MTCFTVGTDYMSATFECVSMAFEILLLFLQLIDVQENALICTNMILALLDACNARFADVVNSNVANFGMNAESWP